MEIQVTQLIKKGQPKGSTTMNFELTTSQITMSYKTQ